MYMMIYKHACTDMGVCVCVSFSLLPAQGYSLVEARGRVHPQSSNCISAGTVPEPSDLYTHDAEHV
jgi:hypothetical protein